MSSNFSKIHKNGVFLVNDILLDRFETIRAVEGEERDRNGLTFIVPCNKPRLLTIGREIESLRLVIFM